MLSQSSHCKAARHHLSKVGSEAGRFGVPFVFAMFPIRPSSLGERMPNSIEGQRIEPALPLCVAESSVMNPFEKMEGQESWFL